MGGSSYPSMPQPFTMSHSASNMSAVTGMRQDTMGIINENNYYHCVIHMRRSIFLWFFLYEKKIIVKK